MKRIDKIYMILFCYVNGMLIAGSSSEVITNV